MINLEKYKEEILNSSGNFCCDFIIPIILKKYDKKCGINVDCIQCKLIQTLWLNEEYKEPETDWTKVEKDTPIRVSDNGTHWYNRYFCKYEHGKVYAWSCGTTSFSAGGIAESWVYARLVKGKKDVSK